MMNVYESEKAEQWNIPTNIPTYKSGYLILPNESVFSNLLYEGRIYRGKQEYDSNM